MKTSGLHINSTLYLLTERLEAKYFYLPHGPLSRVELGKKSIQGLDYAYTLQGWLKDINGYSVGSYNFDIGKDGNPTNYLNKRFVNDLFSLMIQYYQTDYNPISGNNYFNLVSLNSVDLYNGNISALSLGLFDLETMLKSFRYDKLNRIKEMATAYADNNIWGTISDRFKTSYSYDFNGNITNLTRYDNGGNLLHSINYGYEDRRNRLGSINVTGSDISSSSYRYDALGNMILDDAENINVGWNVIGKVRFVQTPNNMLRFAYNPFGQRQIKRTENDSTYYVHDATGNVMGIYIKDDLTLTAIERPIYGSSRLGIMNKAVVFNMNGGLVSKSNSTIGIKEYELSDHLGNVSVVILDRKIFDGDKFAATSLSRTDYYPFGYPIASRSFSLEQYRYGFNGQEKDNEVYGDGKSYTAEFWQYDSRLGRRWNLDPKPNESLSSYSCFANNPIVNCDLKGDTIINGLANILEKSIENLNQKQVIYNNLLNSHIGKLKKSDIRKYRRESGLKDAEHTYNSISSKKHTVDLMIYTYSIVKPTDYSFLNNLPTNIVIINKYGVSKYGELSYMMTLIPAYHQTIIQSSTNEQTVSWDGYLRGDIIITIWDGAKYPYNTSYLANEFGDILYFYSNVFPNDPTSYQKWITTGNSDYPGYRSDPSGAGQQSFKHQYEFMDIFNSIKYQYPERKVDTYNYIIKP